MISLVFIRHLRKKNAVPQELLDSVSVIAAGDDLDLAGAAGLIVESDKVSDTVILYELLAPLKRHFEITKRAFERWHGFNESLENEIMKSNKNIRDRLISRWYLIPDGLKNDAQSLISHYDAWLDKYEKVRPNGIRDTNEPFVFVGPEGHGFPDKSEKKFINYYKELSSKI